MPHWPSEIPHVLPWNWTCTSLRRSSYCLLYFVSLYFPSTRWLLYFVSLYFPSTRCLLYFVSLYFPSTRSHSPLTPQGEWRINNDSTCFMLICVDSCDMIEGREILLSTSTSGNWDIWREEAPAGPYCDTGSGCGVRRTNGQNARLHLFDEWDPVCCCHVTVILGLQPNGADFFLKKLLVAQLVKWLSHF
jgi:hypothetical protein